MAMPTPLEMPWPSGPVVASMPSDGSYSGCPGVLLPHCRKLFRSVQAHLIGRSGAAASSSMLPCPPERMKRSRLCQSGLAGLYFR